MVMSTRQPFLKLKWMLCWWVKGADLYCTSCQPHSNVPVMSENNSLHWYLLLILCCTPVSMLFPNITCQFIHISSIDNRSDSNLCRGRICLLEHTWVTSQITTLINSICNKHNKIGNWRNNQCSGNYDVGIMWAVLVLTSVSKLYGANLRITDDPEQVQTVHWL